MKSVDVVRYETLHRVNNSGGWALRHLDAVNNPGRGEAPILGMLCMLAAYADTHCRRYEAPIAHDSMLGAAWLDMLRGVRALLNGELGRLDGGTLDATILAMHEAAGFEGEL